VHRPQRTPPLDADDEYRAIEATLLETARGRWFLAEHGRRARRLDNALLEDALSRLKSSLREPLALIERLTLELAAAQRLIAAAREELMAKPNSGAVGADAPATAQLLGLAEDVHVLTWSLQGREGIDFDQATCEQIARRAAALYALSGHQARKTEVKREILDKLEDAERRLARLGDSLTLEAGSPDIDTR
jgi:hypothetical protein